MDYEHFYPELSTHFPAYPWLAFDRALNISARTLCRLGLAWRVDLDPIDWVAGESEYPLFLPSDSYVVQLLDAGGLVPTTPHQLMYLDSRWRERTGRPTHYYMQPNGSMRVVPTPLNNTPAEFVPRAALAPTSEASVLDDSYALPHERLLLQGAVANLGRASWGDFEYACHVARSFSTDERQIGVPRTVRYGGL
jgi:hypothetical protein